MAARMGICFEVIFSYTYLNFVSFMSSMASRNIEHMISVIKKHGLIDETVFSAMQKVPREYFVDSSFLGIEDETLT